MILGNGKGKCRITFAVISGVHMLLVCVCLYFGRTGKRTRKRKPVVIEYDRFSGALIIIVWL